MNKNEHAFFQVKGDWVDWATGTRDVHEIEDLDDWLKGGLDYTQFRLEDLCLNILREVHALPAILIMSRFILKSHLLSFVNSHRTSFPTFAWTLPTLSGHASSGYTLLNVTGHPVISTAKADFSIQNFFGEETQEFPVNVF